MKNPLLNTIFQIITILSFACLAGTALFDMSFIGYSESATSVFEYGPVVGLVLAIIVAIAAYRRRKVALLWLSSLLIIIGFALTALA